LYDINQKQMSHTHDPNEVNFAAPEELSLKDRSRFQDKEAENAEKALINDHSRRVVVKNSKGGGAA
jgi:hypothetical protein